MPTEQVTRPRLKHALTATAFGIVTIRNAWRAWARGVLAERRELAAKQGRPR